MRNIIARFKQDEQYYEVGLFIRKEDDVFEAVEKAIKDLYKGSELISWRPKYEWERPDKKVNYPATLLCDFYKISHREQYPQNTEKIYATWTARTSRLEGIDKVVFFGLQAFIKEYLIDYFNDNFFKRPLKDVVEEYRRVIRFALNKEDVDTTHIEELHSLGYLPVRINAVEEGTFVPIRVPMFTIENTIPKFFWVTNYLETLMSCMLWQPMTSATIALEYRKILEKYAKETNGDTSAVPFQGHDFSMRGMSSLESAKSSGAGHLLSFTGTDTIPAILYMEQFYNANIEKELVGSSIPACYDEKTEILTDKGWKFFKNLEKEDKVAQYHEDGSIDFVIPSEHYICPYEGDMIHFRKEGNRYIDLMVTPNHRMVRRKRDTGELSLFEAGSTEYKYRKGYSSKYNMIISGGALKGENSVLSPLDKLAIAFQADGSYPSHKEDYTGERTGCYPIRFSLKKDRKKNRLVEILNELGYKYTLNRYENGYYSFWINSPVELKKDFSWVDLSKINNIWAMEFISELQYWDGKKSSKNTISYSSIIKENVDMVQAIASLCECKGQVSEYIDTRDDYNRKPIYSIIITNNKKEITGSGTIKEVVPYSGKVYCVSVPTKMLVVRRNNVVAVCGNTEHSVQCTYGKESEIDTYRRLINEIYPTGICSIVSDTWDLWKVLTDYLPQIKEDIMSRDGKVVIRPDSGDPVDIICGTAKVKELTDKDFESRHIAISDFESIEEVIADYTEDIHFTEGLEGMPETIYYKYSNIYYKVGIEWEESYYDQYYYINKISVSKHTLTPEEKGVIELLWETFGGTITEQGYKQLDEHIGCIYGDAITMQRCQEICERLKAKGFASTNMVYGIGSYTYQFNTRDTFGFALKTTYAVVDGEERQLFKDPITDNGIKRSQRGMVAVVDEIEGITFIDGLNKVQHGNVRNNMLKPVFVDGVTMSETTLAEIRNKVLSNIK